MTPDPLERAGDLTLALRENTAALNKVMRRQKLTTLALVLLFCLVGVSGYLWDEVRDTQRSSCESGNNVRQGLLNIADVLEDAQTAPHADGRPRTAEEIKQAQSFIASLRTDFALRHC